MPQIQFTFTHVSIQHLYRFLGAASSSETILKDAEAKPVLKVPIIVSLILFVLLALSLVAFVSRNLYLCLFVLVFVYLSSLYHVC